VSHRSFTPKDAALTINYLGFVFRSLVAEGQNATTLLKGTGLTQEGLLNPDFRCTFEQHKAFVQNAIRQTGDPHLGPRMASRFKPLNIGLPASAAMSSDFGATALTVLQQFISLNFSILNFRFYQEGDHVILHWQPALDVAEIEYFVIGSSMVVCENFIRLLLLEEKVTERAELAMPEPPGWSTFKCSLSFPVRFNQAQNRILLPSRILNQPLAGADPLVHQNMLRLCEQQLAESYFDEGIDTQLQKLIVKHHYHPLPIEQAAAELGFSERSLRRQLSQAGTTYKKRIDGFRETRARELLAISGLPITTITYDLGFSDPSNFARTFKRWVGVSPNQYRERIQSGQN